MRNRIPDFFELDRYDVAPEDIVRAHLGCEPRAIQPNVVVTPIWDTSFLDQVAEVNPVSDRRGHATSTYDTKYRDESFTLVKSGIGAPQTGDVLLALGCTPCERLIFTGSVGGLDSSMRIGDLLLAKESIVGEGFSRYLSDEIETTDCFLNTA